ncbi:MAG: cyclic nucleotide-binding domain-containing protein [Thermodesulfobacteriota bacterium]
MREKRDIISNHACFENLNEDQLDFIVSNTKETKFAEKELIFKENDNADSLYIVKKGIVSLESKISVDREPITIQTLGEGDIVGWSWLFPPYKWHFDARADTETEALRIDGKSIRSKCEIDHDLGYELLKRFAGLIQQRLKAIKIQNPEMYTVKKNEYDS